MWSYYGTKKRLAKYYPKPIHDKIIEPFCGAAQYSLYGNNWTKDIYLIDKYEVVTRLWKYLIRASKSDILELPDLNYKDSVDRFDLSDEERWLIGFCINSASSMPKKTAAKYNNWNKAKLEIADNLYKIRHWKVINCSYKDIPNTEATWFIDPPYQFGGEWYQSSVNNSHIDYKELGDWCKSRDGQIIVCENSKADWMDFTPLVNLNGQLHKTTEVIWYNEHS